MLSFSLLVSGMAPVPGGDKNRCYDMFEHKCYCELSEQECADKHHINIWTETCVNPCTSDGDGVGCYNQAGDHKCDCALAQDECTAGTWTSACSWCVGPIPDGPEGCYDTSEHKCDCDISEADCKIPHVWTEGCASCSSSSARTPAVGLAAIR